MALGRMIYKGFKFPANPQVSGFECDRSYVRHKYPELAGNELEDFGPNAVVITGSGEFFGSDAYSNWDKLLTEFNKDGVGKVYHPVYKNVTRGLMTRLKSDLEPRQDYIRYSFEIVADSDPNTSKDNSAVVEIKSVSSNVNDLGVGNIVNFTGNRHYTSSEGDRGYDCKPGTAKVTNINKSGKHPYHLIRVNGGGSTVYGWVDAQYIESKIVGKKSSDNSVVHVVKAGESLSKICSHYSKKYDTNISWKDIAKHNKIKNPNLIYVNQKITIIW